MKVLFFVAIGLMALSVTSASATVLEDFEEGYIGQGTVITDPADPANSVLKLVSNGGDDGVTPEIFSIDTNGLAGTITLDIYDFGATREDFSPFTEDWGPRWGIQGDSNSDGTMDNWVAAGLVQKTWAAIQTGYTYLADDDAFDGVRASSFNGDWWSLNFFGNPRRVKTDPIGAQPFAGDGLQLIGSGTPDNPETPGSGAWTTWQFVIDESGNVSITAKEGTEGKFLDAPYEEDTQTQYFAPLGVGLIDMTITQLDQIWVTGGSGGGPAQGRYLGTHGVLVDNITFDGVQNFSPADFNTDTFVDGTDLDIWEGALGINANGDADDDNDSDGADFLIWQREFTGPGSSVASVPEPSAVLLLLSGALTITGLVTRRRR